MCYLCQVKYGINLVDEVLAHLYTAPPPTLSCTKCPRAKAPHHKHVTAKAGIRKPFAMRPNAKALCEWVLRAF